ncbi:mutS protein homolog 4 [Octopus bimaculoides]|uniref:mutS protein homolog 4 n=1 Tax=Octopus bimaculoides TaxID=37653 RepID=UPI00071E0862|nr:mutS protein homolog 4 [Octopus bimaculoides]|eukprot:XP_014778440.1 PREDICTED: mutS protein homolog 4-like [Octopus bimaculoides]
MATNIKQPKYNFGLLQTPATSDESEFSDTSVSVFNKKPIFMGTKRKQQNLGQREDITPYSEQRLSSSSSDRLKLISSAVKRTPYTSSTTNSDNNAVIAALVEGRGLAKGEIGMASIDLKCPVLVLSQFSDSQTYVKVMTKLQILQPIEIVIPSTACENGNMSKLFQVISNNLSNCCMSTVQRKYFNESKGLQFIRQLCLPDYNSVEMEVASKYYCLATASALLKYVEFIQNIVYAPSTLKIIFRGCENTTMIDVTTAKNLELVQNLRDPKSSHSLFGILNYCKTAGGVRLLRANILQPPSDIETITLRQDVVSELTDNEDLFFNLQSILKRFLDVDHLLSLCVQMPKQETIRTAESKITNIIYLKHILEMLPALQDALKKSDNTLLVAYSKALVDPRIEIMKSKIDSIIHEDTKYQKGVLNMKTQKCFAVKGFITGLLDVARRTYTEIIDDIAELVRQLSEKYKLPLKTSYNSTRGFFMQLYSGNKDKYMVDSLPSIFIKVGKHKNTLSFTTTDLIKLNDRVKESLQEIYLMTNIVVTELLNDIRSCISCLYKLSECVSTLDMLAGFAHLCTLSDYTRPEFTDTVAIKQSRHPILEKIAREPPVPNNTYASNDSNFIIITGPNMSGKSTYLRQVALLQIMAQIGCFVPATYASFRISDQIFTRIGSDDDLETNASTFMLEMREINYIIQNASDTSLIIIDELGRGTSVKEGLGICYAICEYLLSTKAITLFVTHFMELTNLDEVYPNVENYYFEVKRIFCQEGNCEKLTYTHILSQGKTNEKHYGIQLAEVSTIPRSVVEEAKQLLQIVSVNKKVDQNLKKEARKQRAVFKLANRLLQTARNSQLDNESLCVYLGSLKSQFDADLQDEE